MATNPTLITTPFAQSGDKTTPPNTNVPSDGRFSQTLGFPPVTAIPLGSGGKAPKREDFNGAFNMLANLLFYAQKGWQFQWNSGQTYYAGCVVRDTTDGKLYECINDVAAGGSVPSADSVHWQGFLPDSLPVGFIVPFGGSSTMTGWLYCDGSAVSRTTYSKLYAAIGTNWGAGNGSTTFNIPNIADRVLQGASSTNPLGTYKSAGLPNITGTIGRTRMAQDASGTGALYTTTAVAIGLTTSNSVNTPGIGFDASRSSSIYGNSTTVQPPAACVRFLIKYE